MWICKHVCVVYGSYLELLYYIIVPDLIIGENKTDTLRMKKLQPHYLNNSHLIIRKPLLNDWCIFIYNLYKNNVILLPMRNWFFFCQIPDIIHIAMHSMLKSGYTKFQCFGFILKLWHLQINVILDPSSQCGSGMEDVHHIFFVYSKYTMCRETLLNWLSNK